MFDSHQLRAAAAADERRQELLIFVIGSSPPPPPAAAAQPGEIREKQRTGGEVDAPSELRMKEGSRAQGHCGRADELCLLAMELRRSRLTCLTSLL